MKNKICCECGAKNIEYKFSFNKGLASFLKKLYIKNIPCKTDDLDLTYAQRTNSQKLRYWGLAFPYENEDSKTKRGWWQISQLGIDFVEGIVSIKKNVLVFKNNVQGFIGDEIKFSDVLDSYEYHKDYAEQANDQINEEFQSSQGSFVMSSEGA